jgi:hypothetical protein
VLGTSAGKHAKRRKVASLVSVICSFTLRRAVSRCSSAATQASGALTYLHKVQPLLVWLQVREGRWVRRELHLCVAPLLVLLHAAIKVSLARHQVGVAQRQLLCRGLAQAACCNVLQGGISAFQVTCWSCRSHTHENTR